MEKRLAKVNISVAGGTAGKGAKTYKLTYLAVVTDKDNENVGET